MLGSAETFAVLGNTTVTNTGVTIVDGDLGVSPGTAITGFPPGSVVNGSIYTGANAVAVQAHADAMTAYNFLVGESAGTNLTGQDLGGLTLNPGIYKFNTSAFLTGTLFLDTHGDPNAVFHFQIGTTFVTAALSSVITLGLGGAPGLNIFWQVGSSATLGANTALDGNILANTSITLTTGAGIRGRAIAIGAAVTMDSNMVSNAPGAPVLNLGTYWKGGNDNLWSHANWSTDASGLDNTNLLSGANVVFSVTGVTPANQNTVLDFNADIASLTVNDGVAVTISGSNTLTISGAGAITGITVNSGAGFTTIATNVVLAGTSQTITVNNNAGLLMSGVIGGTIGLTKSGTGKLTLTGIEAYTGTTLVSDGTLQLGDGITAGSSIASSNPVIISGSTTLSASNSLPPGTVSSPARPVPVLPIPLPTLILDLADGETFTNNVTDDGLIRTIQSGTTTVSGVISGGGAFTQDGSGTTILTAVNTYSGLTRINSGSLFVEGTVSGDALVAGGTLRGTGMILGDVTATSGVVNPGNAANPAGTLTIRGNYDQGAGVTHVASLTAPNTNNLLAIGGVSQLGPTHLNGTLLVNYVNGFNAVPGNEFTILTSASGVTGRYAQFIDPHATGTLVTLGVFYLPDSVLLKFTQGSFLDVPAINCGEDGLTPNQISVATALDKLASHNPTSPLIVALDAMPTALLPGSYNLLGPVDFAAIFDAGFAADQVQFGNIERRLEEIRDGATGYSEHLVLSDAHGKLSPERNDGKQMIDRDGRDVGSRPLDPRWGFFVTGSAVSVDIDSTCHAAGSDFVSGGVTLGIDYRLGDHFAIGLTTGYANTRSDGIGDGRIDHNSAKANAFATWFDQGFYVSGIIGGGYTVYDTKRASVGGIARGDSEGTDYSGSIGAGYEHHAGGWTMGPIAALQYTTVGLNAFTETGSLAPLHIGDQSENSLQSRVGARISYAWKMGPAVLTPEVRAQWQHEFQDASRGIGSNFAEDPTTSFNVHGPKIGRDSLLADLGASLQIGPRTSLFAFYTGDVGAANYTSQAINGGFRINF
ncbi:MAG: autotransporter domain-containing protein [Verrucomicrobiota bacterium]